MKLLVALCAVLLLVGCNSDKQPKSDAVSAASENAALPVESSAAEGASEAISEVIVKYQGSDNKTYELKSSDNFETAVLTDSQGKNYELTHAISGSGMRLEGEDGIYIHTKGEEGTLVLLKDQLIDIQEVK
jgi:membrane-bound inhibitor of C-type lysozyme